VDELVAGYLTDTDAKLKPFLYHHDQVNSVSAVSGHNGGTIQSTTYGAFGNTRSTTGASPNRLQYTGRENDNTGLYYYRARYYDPEIGRFISEDPLGFGAGDVNFYVYVGNNPVNFNDPSGKIIGIDDLVVWGGLKTAQYAVRGISYVFGNPMTTEQINKMDSSLMSAWKTTTAVTPYVVGATTSVLTGSKIPGLWATWGTETAVGILAGDPSHEIGLPPFDILGTGRIFDMFDAIDLLNPTPLNEGNFSSLNSTFSNQAAGGFVLYPNKPNTNMMQSVYAK
jgi:RHS repeat-associated protein